MSNSKKTIWIINQFAGSLKSGWGERHYFLSKKWLEKSYRVVIVSSTFNHMFNNFTDDKHQFNFENIDGTEFCWIKTPKYNPRSVLRFWAMLVFAFKSFFVPISKAGKPDIIIVSSMPIFPSLTGWLLKKRYKSEKYIFEIRDIWPLTAQLLMGYKKWHPMIVFMSWFEKIGYRKSNHIVSVLPNAATHINSISGKPEKFKYIPNGISEELLDNMDLPQTIAKQIPDNKFIIGYTGTIGLANALEYLIESAITLKNDEQIHFIFVGDGYLKEELIQKSKEIKNVTFISKIRKSYMQSMISHFDVCFIGRNNSPLFDHGVSSNKYFDYMLARKPILVSSNRIKDPVEMSNCGVIIEPENTQAIVHGILTLYNMSDHERSEMGLRGYEYVKKYHNFDYLSSEYEKLFK
jgi:glycosyltransferase involved in cell wall biosynthesis